MAGTYSKAVVPIQTVILKFATAAAVLAARARFRLPQAVRILRVAASHLVSSDTACTVDVQANHAGGGAATILAAPLATIQFAAPDPPVGQDTHVNGAVELGAHSWKITMKTAAGETDPSVKSIVVTPAAPAAPVAALKAEAGNVNAGNHSYKVTFVNAAGESVASAKSNVVLADGGHGKVDVTVVAGPAGTTARKIYRTVAGDAGNWKLLDTLADNVTLAYVDDKADGDLGADAPAGTGTKVELALPVGGAGTIARRIYRTVTGDGGDHLLVAEIANNVDLTYLDNVADGALGAAAPTVNTAHDGVINEVALTDPTDGCPGRRLEKEDEITVDVAGFTAAGVTELCCQIDYVPVD